MELLSPNIDIWSIFNSIKNDGINMESLLNHDESSNKAPSTDSSRSKA